MSNLIDCHSVTTPSRHVHDVVHRRLWTVRVGNVDAPIVDFLDQLSIAIDVRGCVGDGQDLFCSTVQLPIHI